MPRCHVPRSVSVKGHWRYVRKHRKKKRATPQGPYWTAASSRGACGHRHRTAGGAQRCASRLNREERARHARFATRKNKLRLVRWTIEKR